MIRLFSAFKEPIWSSKDRPFRCIPLQYRVFFIAAILVQLISHHLTDSSRIKAQKVPEPLGLSQLQLLSAGESALFSRLLMLWVQTFDNQAGVKIALQDMDYPRLVEWLERIGKLDERSQYPVFSALHIYSAVQEPARKRLMYHYVEQRFLESPRLYWRWLAYASVMARHQLKDDMLALRYAKLLRERAVQADIPGWAAQMEISILEQQGEYRSAQLLIGGLLAENRIKDPHERAFLNERLRQLREAEASKTP